MSDQVIQSLMTTADAHSGHLIALIFLKLGHAAFKAGQEVLDEIRQIKDSLVLLNQQMVVVVNQVGSHDVRLTRLEGKTPCLPPSQGS